jgi:hypothetical protein
MIWTGLKTSYEVCLSMRGSISWSTRSNTINTHSIFSDALHSVIDMVATISNVARLLSRANRFHLSNLLMDASDRVVHLPPKNEVENS